MTTSSTEERHNHVLIELNGREGLAPAFHTQNKTTPWKDPFTTGSAEKQAKPFEPKDSAAGEALLRSLSEVERRKVADLRNFRERHYRHTAAEVAERYSVGGGLVRSAALKSFDLHGHPVGYTNEDGTCMVSAEAFAERFGLPRSALSAAAQAVCRAGSQPNQSEFASIATLAASLGGKWGDAA